MKREKVEMVLLDGRDITALQRGTPIRLVVGGRAVMLSHDGSRPTATGRSHHPVKKPFQCRICQERFATKQQLGGHVNKHSKEERAKVKR